MDLVEVHPRHADQKRDFRMGHSSFFELHRSLGLTWTGLAS